MNCPHCKKEIVVKTTVHRAVSPRHEYWQRRHIESGKAKVRTSIEQLGICTTQGCNNETYGKKERCKSCERKYLNQRNREYYAKDKEKAA